MREKLYHDTCRRIVIDPAQRVAGFFWDLAADTAQ
jgi:hypothetical protein